MFEHSFTLTQHTPVIQFELDQEEALLRATELKPRFDRYLTEAIGRNAIDPGWLVPGWEEEEVRPSFDYRMTIRTLMPVRTLKIHQPSNSNWNSEEPGFPGFFALLGETADNPDRVFRWAGEAVVTIKTLDDSLGELVRTHFPDFIWGSNFGLRKSKGFGSFTVKDSPVPQHRIAGFEEVFQRFSFSSRSAEQALDAHHNWGGVNEAAESSDEKRRLTNFFAMWYGLFADVDAVHRIMRSGWSKPVNGGFPALSAYFAQNQGYRTEKEVLKSHVNPKVPRRPVTDGDRALRELFGLSNDQSWGSGRSLHVDAIDDRIGRFASPLLYKPILSLDDQGNPTSCVTYVLPKPIPHEMLNTAIKYEPKKGAPLTVKTPNQFSMCEFLEFVVNWARDEEDEELKHRESKRMVQLFRNLEA